MKYFVIIFAGILAFSGYIYFSPGDVCEFRIAALNTGGIKDIKEKIILGITEKAVNLKPARVIVKQINTRDEDTVISLDAPGIFGNQSELANNLKIALDSYIEGLPDRIVSAAQADSIFDRMANYSGNGSFSADVVTGSLPLNYAGLVRGNKFIGAPKKRPPRELLWMIYGPGESGRILYDMLDSVNIYDRITDKKIKLPIPPALNNDCDVFADFIILSPFNPAEARKIVKKALSSLNGNFKLRVLSANHNTSNYAMADMESLDFFLGALLTNTESSSLDDLCALFRASVSDCMRRPESAETNIFVFGYLPEAEGPGGTALFCMQKLTQDIAKLKGYEKLKFHTHIFSGDKKYPLDEDLIALLRSNEIKIERLEIEKD